MKLYKQINNLKIYNMTNGGWIVKAPNGKFLETFGQRHSAENWCKKTLDFVKNKKKL
jgi:hypothetical protein